MCIYVYIYIYIYIFSRLFDVSTSSCAHLTIILSFSSVCLCHSNLLLLIHFPTNSPLIPSAQAALGLPRFLLPGGLHFITFFGSLPSSILWTCPYHFSCLVLISSKRDLVTFIFCLIIMFLILSFLEIRIYIHTHIRFGKPLTQAHKMCKHPLPQFSSENFIFHIAGYNVKIKI